MTLSYETYKFVPPIYRISEKSYLKLKMILREDPDFSLIKEEESVFEKFKYDIIIFVLLIPVFAGIITLMALYLFSISSYKKYLRHRRNYYDNLLYSIENSETYEDFYLDFYGEEYSSSERFFVRDLF